MRVRFFFQIRFRYYHIFFPCFFLANLRHQKDILKLTNLWQKEKANVSSLKAKNRDDQILNIKSINS